MKEAKTKKDYVIPWSCSRLFFPFHKWGKWVSVGSGILQRRKCVACGIEVERGV